MGCYRAALGDHSELSLRAGKAGDALPEEELSADLYRTRVAKSFLWQGGAKFLGQAISWLSTVMVIRLLTPDDYGLMAMATLVVGLLMLVSDLGVSAATIQVRNLNPEQLGELFGFAILVNCVAAGVVFLGAPVAAAFFREPRLIGLLRILSGGFLLVALYVLPESLLMRDLRFDQKARADVLATAVSAVLTFSLALKGFGVWSLVGGSLTIHGVRALVFRVLRPRPLVPRFSFGRIKGMLEFGKLITLNRILWFSYENLDVAIAGRVLGKSLVGIYSVALSLASIPLEKIIPIITQVSFAAFSRIQTDSGRVRRNVLRALQAVSLLALPTSVGMAVVAPEFIQLVLGPKWIQTVAPFQIVCLILPLRALGALLPPALFGIGQPFVNIVNMAITLGVMSVAFLVGIQYGIIGLCLGWAVAYPLVFCVTAHRSLRALGIPVREAVSVVRFPVGATLIMAVGVIGGRTALDAVLAPPALLASLVVLGVGIYAGMVIGFNRNAFPAFRGLLRTNP